MIAKRRGMVDAVWEDRPHHVFTVIFSSLYITWDDQEPTSAVAR